MGWDGMGWDGMEISVCTDSMRTLGANNQANHFNNKCIEHLGSPNCQEPVVIEWVQLSGAPPSIAD